MTHWVYEKVDLASAPLKAKDSDIALLNELGRNGWDLVVVTTNAQAYVKKAVDPATKSAVRGRA
jgi:phosphoglycolate phosphatase-like HAD superfamily hydrolase